MFCNFRLDKIAIYLCAAGKRIVALGILKQEMSHYDVGCHLYHASSHEVDIKVGSLTEVTFSTTSA